HHMAASQVLLDSSALPDVKRAQFSAHHQSIKPAQHTVDPVCKLRDKLFHGVPFFRDTCLETHIIRRLRTPFHFGCGSAALSLCVEWTPSHVRASPGKPLLPPRPKAFRANHPGTLADDHQLAGSH